jgi:hypothetical protein
MRIIEIKPEYGVDRPLWDGGIHSDAPDLDISQPLRSRLIALQRTWEAIYAADSDEPRPSWSDYKADVELIRSELQAELGPSVTVTVWLPQFAR